MDIYLQHIDIFIQNLTVKPYNIHMFYNLCIFIDHNVFLDLDIPFSFCW